jgi:site-specific DNA-methyltransferase (adenine-specific)
VTPYYASPDGSILVYHARWEDALAAGVVPVREVALVHDDPPYGVAERTDRASKGRGIAGRMQGGPAGSRDFPPIAGDSTPYDPAPVLALDRRTVTWGANHYADKLPRSASWILWDKREDVAPDDNADGELAWTSLGGPLRIFRHLWRGLCRASEAGDRVLGPTQKPIALCSWVYARARLKPGSLVFVPHGGSGPDLPAARSMGLRLIWCDVERWCCDTAIARLPDAPIEIVARAKEWQRRHVTPERAAEPVGPLFAEARR